MNPIMLPSYLHSFNHPCASEEYVSPAIHLQYCQVPIDRIKLISSVRLWLLVLESFVFLFFLLLLSTILLVLVRNLGFAWPRVVSPCLLFFEFAFAAIICSGAAARGCDVKRYFVWVWKRWMKCDRYGKSPAVAELEVVVGVSRNSMRSRWRF